MATTNMQAVGKVVLVYGAVKAVSAAGFERILAPNSVIYANERIVTGPDGSASITFFHSANQLVLGRMSDVAIDEDVYGGGTANDAVAQVHDIQSALQQDGSLDPTVDLPPPAAGAGVTGSDPRGGGRQIVIFEANQMEVIPDSGAETTGIGLTFLDPPPGALPGQEIAFVDTPPPVEDVDDTFPELAVGNQSVSESGGLQSVTGLFALNYGANGTGSLALSAAGAAWDAGARTLTGPNNAWVLVVHDNGTYTFTQLAPLQHGPDGSATDDALDIVVTATVTDGDGDRVSRDLTITVNDDGPTLAVGSVALNESGLLSNPSGISASGALDIEYGTDGPGSLTLSAAGAMWDAGTRTLTGPDNAWVLVVHDNGTYTFTQLAPLQHGPNGSATDDALDIVVTATATDGDGDSVSRDLTITVNDHGPTLTVSAPPFEQVYDAYVGVSEEGQDQITGTLRFSYGADGPGNLVLSADGARWDSELQTLFGPNDSWSIVVNPNGTYTFSLQKPMTHGLPGSETDGTLYIHVTATVTDSDGDSETLPFTIRVIDDVPQAVDDSNSIAADATEAITANVLTNDLHTNGQPNADAPISFVNWTSTAATYGTFTDMGNGNYAYNVDPTNATVRGLAAGQTLTEEFHYTMQDADGDQATATLTITINGANDAPVAVDDSLSGTEGVALVIGASDLFGPDGTGQGNDSDVDSASFANITITELGTNGTLQLNGTTVTQGQVIAVADIESGLLRFVPNTGFNGEATFKYTVSDGDSSSNPATVRIDFVKGIADGNESVSTLEDTACVGNVLANTTNAAQTASVLNFVIDNHTYSAGDTADISGRGTLTVYANGEYVFNPLQNYSGSVPQVTYMVGDGVSTHVSTLDISIAPVVDVPNVGVTIGDPTVITTSISAANVTSTDQGFTVTAYNLDSSVGEIAIRTDGSPPGFGVIGESSGDQTELGQHEGSSERIEVAFGTPVSKAELSFSWLAQNEHAEYTLYDGNGVVIGHDIVTGVTDYIDDPLTLAAANGALISKIVFTAPIDGWDNDFLIHDISFTTGTSYAVNVTVSPTDLDGSEHVSSIDLVIPAGVVLSAGMYNASNGTWHLSLESNGSYVVSTDSTNAVTISGLTMTAPTGFSGQPDVTVMTTIEDGTEQANFIIGNAGDNTLVGGDGNHILIGGAGNDTLTGGGGADVFKVGNGHDTITDYHRADGDTVDISDVLSTAADDISRLGLLANDGKAQLAIYDNANHDHMIGSVTFENIDYHAGDTLESLLGQIDLNHTK